VLNNHQFLVSLFNSVIITASGTLLSLILTSFAAYAMTKKEMPFSSAITALYIITMFFGGGMIPTYLLYKQIGLYDNLLVLILPGAISVFNIILMRNFFESIPPALEEAAMIDGASYMQVLFKIILPLSKAAMATIGLFYAVGYWNSFFNAMLFTSKPSLMPLQLYLRNLVLNLQDNGINTDWEALTHVVPDSVRAATIVAAMLPILMVYPFAQKYFVKGVMLGSVKE
jgi:putative aldouronate transport system permease protein